MMRIVYAVVLIAAIYPGVADADIVDEVCTAPAIVYGASAKLDIPANEIGHFVAALHAFTDRYRYYYLPGPSQNDDGLHLAIIIMKRDSDGGGIQISYNAAEHMMIAHADECGGESFLPAWREFVTFLNVYLSANKNALLEPEPR